MCKTRITEPINCSVSSPSTEQVTLNHQVWGTRGQSLPQETQGQEDPRPQAPYLCPRRCSGSTKALSENRLPFPLGTHSLTAEAILLSGFNSPVGIETEVLQNQGWPLATSGL